MIEVRPAVRDDADDLAWAHIEGWRVGYRHLLPADYLQSDEFAQVRLDRWRAWTWPQPRAEMFAGVLDGRVVGFGHAGPEDEPPVDHPDRGEVYGFYLHPDAWGSGVATALMQACSEFLRTAGFAQAVLWVLRDNPRARGFYEKVGWSPTGLERMFGGPQAMGSMPGELHAVQYFLTLS
jgi:GNAT superfamily N-acetyltransferase